MLNKIKFLLSVTLLFSLFQISYCFGGLDDYVILSQHPEIGSLPSGRVKFNPEVTADIVFGLLKVPHIFVAEAEQTIFPKYTCPNTNITFSMFIYFLKQTKLLRNVKEPKIVTLFTATHAESGNHKKTKDPELMNKEQFIQYLKVRSGLFLHIYNPSSITTQKGRHNYIVASQNPQASLPLIENAETSGNGVQPKISDSDTPLPLEWHIMEPDQIKRHLQATRLPEATSRTSKRPKKPKQNGREWRFRPGLNPAKWYPQHSSVYPPKTSSVNPTLFQSLSQPSVTDPNKIASQFNVKNAVDIPSADSQFPITTGDHHNIEEPRAWPLTIPAAITPAALPEIVNQSTQQTYEKRSETEESPPKRPRTDTDIVHPESWENGHFHPW